MLRACSPVPFVVLVGLIGCGNTGNLHELPYQPGGADLGNVAGSGGGNDLAPTAALSVTRAATVANGGTDALGPVPVGTARTVTYTLHNAGAADAHINDVSISAPANCTAAVSGSAPTVVAAGGSADVVIDYSVTAVGPFQFAVAVDHDGGNALSFTVAGNGAVHAPQLEVHRIAGSALASGGSDAVGNVAVGGAGTFSYTISNLGLDPLTLTATPAVAVGALNNCAVMVTQPGATSVASGSSTTFSLVVTPVAEGPFSFNLTVANNDADHNPYTLAVSGAAVTPHMSVQRPAGTAIGDGTTDTLAAAALAGTQLQLTYTIANDGSAPLQLTGLSPVAVANLVNCSVAVAQQPSSPVAPSATTTFVLNVTPAGGGAFGFDVSVANDADLLPYAFAVSGTATAPEIDVQRPAGSARASGSTDAVGSTAPGTPMTVSFTLANLGTADLHLAGSVTISNQSNCAATISAAPSATVAASASTTLTLSVTPAAAGAFSFDLSIASDDADENPYVLTVSGSAVAAPAIDVFTPFAGAAPGSTIRMNRVQQGKNVVVPVVVRNSGTSAVTLGAVTISDAANCTATLREAPASTTIAAGDATTFSVLMVAGTTAAGVDADASFKVSVAANGAAAYDFTVQAPLVNSPAILYRDGTNLYAATFPGAPVRTTLKSAVQYYYHRDHHALVAATNNNATDLFWVGLAGALPTTPQNLTQAITDPGNTGTSYGSASWAVFTTGDDFVFVASVPGTVQRLYSVHVAGDTASAPVELTGSLNGATNGVNNMIVSPRGDKVAFIGDFDTPGLGELYVVGAGGGARTKLNAAYPTASGWYVSNVQWFLDESRLVYELSSSAPSTPRRLYLVDLRGASPVATQLSTATSGPGVYSNAPYQSTRVSDSGTHVFFEQADASNHQELFVVSLIGGTPSAAVGLNGGSAPAGTNVSIGVNQDYSIDATGTRVLFTADTGVFDNAVYYQAAKELYYSTIAGATPTTTKLVSVAAPVGAAGCEILPDAGFVTHDRALYGQDVHTNRAYELQYLDLSGATPTTYSLTKGTPAFASGAYGIGDNWNGHYIVAHPDGQHVFYRTDQTGTGLVAATLSATPGAFVYSGGSSYGLVFSGSSVFYTRQLGGVAGAYSNTLAGSAEVLRSNTTNVSVNFEVFSPTRIVYFLDTYTYPHLWTADTAVPEQFEVGTGGTQYIQDYRIGGE